MKYLVMAVVVAVIVAVAIRLRNKGLGESRHSLPGSPRPLLRQFGDLRPQDFEDYPVWVSCHIIDYDEPWYDDADEETFRPWSTNLPANPAVTMFLVKATLTMTDGTVIPGFLTPQDPAADGREPDLGRIQPQAFLPDGKLVGFWSGILTPAREDIGSFYAAFGKSPREVFPIAFQACEGLATGVTSGSIPGFCSMGVNGEVKVLK